MTVLASALDVGGADFAAHREAMLARLAALDAEHAKALAGGGEKYVERHRKRGKLLARERIELLLDPDTPFLELSPLAAWGSDYTVGASLVTGIGVVEGVECLITANDPTVRGGASNPWTLKKALRANEIAFANRLPCISLVESGGADLPSQKEIFIPGGAHLPRHHAPLRRRDPHRRRRLRQLHRRRRVHPRHVRPRDHGQGAGEGLPRRAAPGEDGDRRGERRRVARRRRDARPYVRARRLLRRRRAGRDPAGPPRRRPPQPPQGVRGSAARGAAQVRRGRTPRHRARRPQGPLRPARGDRPDRRRLRLRRVQAAVRVEPHDRLGVSCTAIPSASSPTRRACCSARSRRRPPSSSSSPTSATSRSCSCTTPPATWSARSTSRAASSSTAR